jgi:hypothetical protein
MHQKLKNRKSFPAEHRFNWLSCHFRNIFGSETEELDIFVFLFENFNMFPATKQKRQMFWGHKEAKFQRESERVPAG